MLCEIVDSKGICVLVRKEMLIKNQILSIVENEEHSCCAVNRDLRIGC